MTATTGLLAGGGLLATQQAHAASTNVYAKYGCNQATFVNNTSKTANVNYGTAGSGDVKSVKVAAGQSRTITMRHTSFGWTATHADGTEVGGQEFPGVDLTDYCSSKSPTAKPTTPSKDTGGGLAKTDF
ncbi:hypothetical protein [Mariniluteicoccus flavus]